MAITAEGEHLTQAHRQIQAHVNMATLRDLLRLWPVVDPKNLRGTLDPFVNGASALVQNGRRMSSAASKSYYASFREAEGLDGTHAVALAVSPPDEVVVGALRGAALAGIVNGYRRGLTTEQAQANGYVKMAGSASQLVVGGGRATLLGAVQSDPEATGWQRVTDGNPCAFCAMVASQGIVYKGDDTASFEAHGHCLCTAEPAFEGSTISPANQGFRDAFKASTGGLSGTDALNAFRRSR